ncbi:AraC family transcriptional regulator [Ruminococcus sp. 5_1_39BFAA]|uniref:AraC family transcriptional regulator n=1 Tax=Ruminococcus sp. 5_1_39BFAA TaxID=457412 RepID=UPI00356535BB
MKHIYMEGISTSSTIFFHTPSNRIPDFFYYPVCIGRYFCNIPYKTDRNRYDSFLLLYTKSGKGLLSVDGQRRELLPGDVCLIDCYRPHIYQALQEWEIMWLHFDGELSRSYFQYLTDKSFFHTSLKQPLSYEKDWNRLYEQFVNHEAMVEPLLSQYISQLLTHLALAKEEGGYKAAPDFIDDTLKYINRHLSSDLPLEFLADRVSLSPFYFSRKFKEETGYSPYQYILTSRINLARFYLKTSKETVKNIGYTCGFKSEHSFCTAFKNETGQTPSEFRRN